MVEGEGIDYKKLDYEEGLRIIKWIEPALHRLFYKTIVNIDGDYSQDVVDEETLFNLSKTLSHNAIELVNNYRQLQKYGDTTKGINIITRAFNPIDNTEDAESSPNESIQKDYTQWKLESQQDALIKSCYEIIQRIKNEYQQYILFFIGVY
jgi:hypothetical protein